MDPLTGEDADSVLQEWWAYLVDHPGQHIVHAIWLHQQTSRFFSNLPAYRVWLEHGPEAVENALRQLFEDSLSWSYIADARAVFRNHGTNIRIVIVSQQALDNPDSWQRFWVEVHGRFFAAFCGEEVWLLTEQQVRAAGIEPSRYDRNIWGDCGVMLTYYRPDGDEEGRAFLEVYGQIVEAKPHYEYIWELLELARGQGRRIRRAPAEITPHLDPIPEPE